METAGNISDAGGKGDSAMKQRVVLVGGGIVVAVPEKLWRNAVKMHSKQGKGVDEGGKVEDEVSLSHLDSTPISGLDCESVLRCWIWNEK